MSLSQISYNGITVLPMRPEYDKLSFSSPDVPHGTDAVYYKAAKILRHEHKQAISLPTFTAEEIASMKSDKESNLTVSEVMDGENGTGVFEVKEGETVHVSYSKDMFSQEIGELMKIYLVSDPMLLGSSEQKAEVREGDKNWKFADEDAAFQSILAEKKTAIASSLIDKAIDECLIVPTLSDEWKAQFTLTEVPEM